jgi:hypothetical protein
MHCWPAAPRHVEYLASPHRHRFIIHTSVRVDDPDRQVEFITLGQDIERWLDSEFPVICGILDLGTLSCEHLAARIMEHFGAERVTVSEDGEHSATLEWRREG